MAYESVDQLQKLLTNTVFNYAKDGKKAAGRALGTLVEIITFYLLKSWGFEHSIAIERALEEYGNPDISHNVEYSLHPILSENRLTLAHRLPITASRILANADEGQLDLEFKSLEKTGNVMLTSGGILRNSCTVAWSQRSSLVATLESKDAHEIRIAVVEQYSHPYAIFECKRVGVEEGMKKGPQTIEKAKQGAYVARSVSSLQKIRTPSGELHGLIYKSDDEIYSKPYDLLMAEVIDSDDPNLLQNFILTVGVVSNHGNWFTSDDHNKELKVLAQSYDWLLFLTDQGLAEFITEMLLEPKPLLEPARAAFLASYSGDKTKNQFTKVQMDYDADQVLQAYFKDNADRVERWFNVIAPAERIARGLHLQLSRLRDKNWKQVYGL